MTFQENSEANSSHSLRRKVAIAGFVVIAIAVLALIPPLINVTRLQHRIATSMSETLGRPVHLDPNITLHVFPMPGLTLHNLVVSEDPAFGYEPTISASTVDVTLRVSSLWRRHVEFSRIHFVHKSDESAPSLNIVRNAQGRWNLESLLMHASRVDAAPTAQKSAGSAPRFPYIEATDARVNLKLGDEKMPFSLTEADFALWLPSAKQWHVRLTAKPSRTDENVADPGAVRMEGTFERAANLRDVPVDLHASWRDAQLGEASRLLTGDDAGWRGTLHLDVALSGLLSNAKLSTKLTLDELRRADFVPGQPLDVAANCEADADVTTTMLRHTTCNVPTVEGAQPIVISSEALDLQRIEQAELKVVSVDVPATWALGWMKLVSPRIPADASAQGAIASHFTRDAQRIWSGDATYTVPASIDHATPATIIESKLTSNVDAASPCKNMLALSPANVKLNAASTFTLNGSLTACGYSLHAAGQGTATQLTRLTAIPALSDNVADAMPKSDTPSRFDVTCTRSNWSDAQVCSASSQQPATTKKRRR